MLERRGTLAVVYARIMPGVPYVPFNYAIGLTSLPLRSLALGTAIGAVPRTFAYVALGGNLDDLSAPEVKVAIALIVVIGAAGALLVWREWAAGPPVEPA
jgi:uncharacterized membrane protein YdjX (TVP38/TMEM64 family)